jgi:molybdate transport system substrate-binding protein
MIRLPKVRNLFIVALAMSVLAACGEPAATPTQVAQPTAQPTIPTGGNLITPESGLPATTTPGGSTGISTREGKELLVFAASSLKDVFESMDAAFETAKVGKVSYNFAGSQVLAAQIKQGAAADVIVTADEKTTTALIADGYVPDGTQRLLATNKLVVIVPPGASPKVASLNDLLKTGTKIVIADSTVPAGAYTEQALDKMSADKALGADFKERVLANVVSRENNVRQVLTKVQLGEADAGFVYATDAKSTEGSTSGAVGTIPIPDGYNVVAKYFIAPVVALPHATAGLRFIKYLLTDEGQKAMAQFGFGPNK